MGGSLVSRELAECVVWSSATFPIIESVYGHTWRSYSANVVSRNYFIMFFG